MNTDAGRLSLQWLSRDTREKSALKLAEKKGVRGNPVSLQCVRDIGVNIKIAHSYEAYSGYGHRPIQGS